MKKVYVVKKYTEVVEWNDGKQSHIEDHLVEHIYQDYDDALFELEEFDPRNWAKNTGLIVKESFSPSGNNIRRFSAHRKGKSVTIYHTIRIIESELK